MAVNLPSNTVEDNSNMVASSKATARLLSSSMVLHLPSSMASNSKEGMEGLLLDHHKGKEAMEGSRVVMVRHRPHPDTEIVGWR